MAQQLLKERYNIITYNTIIDNEDLCNIKSSSKIGLLNSIKNDKLSNCKIYESFIYYISNHMEIIKIVYKFNNEEYHLCLETSKINEEVLENIYRKTWKNNLRDVHNELYHVFWKKKMEKMNEEFITNYWSIENMWLWNYQVESMLFYAIKQFNDL